MDQPWTRGGTIAGEELRRGLRVLLAVVPVGLLVGLVWLLVAPRTPLQVVGGQVILADPEGEAAIAVDGWFAVTAAVAGLACAVATFAVIRRARIGALLGLVVGGLLASVVAWRVGAWLGPDGIRESARGLPSGARFDGPLEVSAKGVLLAWPMASVVAYFALVAGLEPPAPRPGQEAPTWRAPAGLTAGTAAAGRRFPTTVLRPGYVVADVDRLFERIEQDLATVDEARAATFGSTRLTRGYDEAEVDMAVDAWIASRASQV